MEQNQNESMLKSRGGRGLNVNIIMTLIFSTRTLDKPSYPDAHIQILGLTSIQMCSSRLDAEYDVPAKFVNNVSSYVPTQTFLQDKINREYYQHSCAGPWHNKI